MRCVGCNAPVEIPAGERVGFRDVCPQCDTDLHSCVHCAHYDPGAYNDCREPGAERVSQRDRANRCDWFSPGDAAGGGGVAAERGKANAALDALFKKT